MIAIARRYPFRVVIGVALLVGTALGLVIPLAHGEEVTEVYGVSAPDEPIEDGIGEKIIIVATTDTFSTTTDAQQAADALNFGDLQGFYVDRTDNYEVLGFYAEANPKYILVTGEDGEVGRGLAPVRLVLQDIPPRIDWIQGEPVAEGSGEPGQPQSSPPPHRLILLTGFRTKTGAEEFMDLATAAGIDNLVAIRVVKLAGGYIGLGQESAPDGSGPLQQPLANPDLYQT